MGGELTVGDYVTLQRGTTYKGQLVGKPGPALLGLGSIIPGGGFREGDYKTYGGDCPPKLMLCPGDIFASLKGATKDGKMIGSVARVPRSVPSGRLTQDTVKLEFKGANKEVSDYLYWVLRTPQYRDYCDRHATGSAVVALSREAFLNYPVPPITSIRKKIVSILEFIESKIELNRQINQTLEQIAQTIFKSWFVDFEPVKAKIEAKAAGRDPERAAMCAISGKLEPELDQLPPEQRQQLAATAALFPDALVESELGLIPEGWNCRKLEDFVEVVDYVANGSFASLKENVQLQNTPGYALFVRTTDFNSGFSGDFRFVNKAAYEFLKKSSLDGSEVIISNVGDVGTVFRAPKWLGYPMTLGSNAVALKSKNANPFLFHFFRGHEGQFAIQSIVTGSAQLKFNKTNLRGLDVAVPSDSILDHFSGISNNIQEDQDNLEAENRSLATLRDTLLPKLLSGEIEVNNVVAGD